MVVVVSVRVVVCVVDVRVIVRVVATVVDVAVRVDVRVVAVRVIVRVVVTAEEHFQKADRPDADPACTETPCLQQLAMLAPQQASYGVDTAPSPQVLSDP